MIRRLLIAPSARDQFNGGRKLTARNLATYRLFMEREVIRGLLPIEKIRVFQYPHDFESFCYLDKDRYVIQYSTMLIKGKSLLENLDIQMGLLIHECGHCIFTIFDKNEPNFYETQSKLTGVPEEWLKDVDNVYEDVHIENRLSTEILGTGNYLQVTREFLMENIQEDLKKIKEIGLRSLIFYAYNDKSVCDDLLNSEKNIYGYTWEDIEPIIQLPKSTIDVHDLTLEAAKTLKKEELERLVKDELFDKLISQIFEAMGGALIKSAFDKMQNNTDKDNESREMEERKGKPCRPKSLKFTKAKTVKSDKLGNEKNASIDRDSSNTGATNTNFNKKKASGDSSSEELPDYGSEATNEPEYIPDDLEKSPLGTSEVQEGIIDQTVVWYKQKVKDEMRYEYDEIARRVAPDAAVLRSIFEKYNVGGWKIKSQLDSGKIDRRFIHRVPLDDQRVFKQMEKRVNAPLDVITLIDESGSMGGSKYLKAREVAILIHEALYKIPEINFWCYGHTTHSWEDDCEMHIYHEGKVTDRMEKYRLANINAYSGNCDGRAILEAASRVYKRIDHKRKVLMILISDGLPSESCPGLRPDEFAKRAALEVERKMGFDFIHVGIDCSNHSLYKHSIDYVSNSQLTQVIGQLVSEHIQKNRAKL